MATGSLVAGSPHEEADRPGRLSRAWQVVAHPVPVAVLTAAVLHLLWLWLIANSGGDLAAQDAWAEFARAHPGSAYDLAWYGGMHPVSYSAISPYVMAVLGVRTTMMLAGITSAGLLALVLVRSGALRRPLWPAVYGAFALTGNAVSGRVTFGLGVMFGLAAVAVVFAWPARWRSNRREHRLPRGALAAVLSALATASSPVAGLFVGIVAAALWLSGRRPAAYTIGLPPVAVVALSALLFPFSGEQPMAVRSTIFPVLLGLCCLVLAPASWRTVRIGSALYAAGVVVVWLVPSQIGSNSTRLALIFGGVVLVAMAAQATPPRRPVRLPEAFGVGRTSTAIAIAVVVSTCWQVGTAVSDVVNTRAADTWTLEAGPLIHQLEVRHADLARVEVVPARSHREASALAPYVNLARGWNRQADAELNLIFYDDSLLTASSYRAWLDRWAVGYVFLPNGEPDPAAVREAALVAGGVDYLHQVWTGASGRLYAVRSPTPLASAPAVIQRFDATEVVLTVPSAGSVLVRIPASPWLTLLDAQGRALEGPESPAPGFAPVNVDGCLSKQVQPASPVQGEVTWTVLEAPRAGTYRIAAPYNLPRGTACPEGDSS
jgi:hypothetical protein